MRNPTEEQIDSEILKIFLNRSPTGKWLSSAILRSGEKVFGLNIKYDQDSALIALKDEVARQLELCP